MEDDKGAVIKAQEVRGLEHDIWAVYHPRQ